jgi:hypothetical protein
MTILYFVGAWIVASMFFAWVLACAADDGDAIAREALDEEWDWPERRVA